MSSDKQLDVPKNPGKRGETWDVFVVAWQESAQAQFESYDDYSWYDVTEGRDQGAVNGPQIAAAGAGQREGQSKRKKRQLAVQRALSKAQEDPRLRRMIINLAPGDNSTNDAAGDGIGRRAWLLLVRECGEAQTPLEIRGRKKEYASVTIRGTVGFSVASITDLNRELTLIDGKIPVANRHGDTEQSERVLECVPHLTSTGTCSFSGASSTHGDNTEGCRLDAGNIASSIPTSVEAGAQVPEPMQYCQCTRLHGNPLGCECLTDRPSGLCQWCEEDGSADGARCNCLCRACNDIDIGADDDG